MPVIKPKIEYNPDHYQFKRRLEPWETLEREEPWYMDPMWKRVAWSAIVLGLVVLMFIGDGVM